MKGATSIRFIVPFPVKFQSALPMKGATRYAERRGLHAFISIRAPNERSDEFEFEYGLNPKLFQSALPMKGATVRTFTTQSQSFISIRAPNERSDVV